MMLFPRTKDFLRLNGVLWNDGYLVFGFGEVDPPGRNMAAALRFFGLQHVGTAISGSSQELRVTEQALRRVDLYRAHHMLVSLLAEELRMYSSYPFELKYLEDLATLFFEEMGECEVYTNMSPSSAGLDTCRASSWSPVTNSSRDFFLCAINDRHLGYWLYTDNE